VALALLVPDAASAATSTDPQPGAPSATIASPSGNPVYAVGQVVDAGYACAEGAGGPGISSCSGTVGNGGRIDTSTPGVHTISVTAVSLDGLSTSVSASYTVAGPPSVSISSPPDGSTFTRGQAVRVHFGCAEDEFGPGLASCSGPSMVHTGKLGPFSFTVTAASIDGQRSTQTIYYRVVLPSNQFVVSGLRSHGQGRVTFRIVTHNPGTLRIVEAVPGWALSPQTGGRAVFAERRLTVRKAGMLHVVVTPSAAGRSLLKQHAAALPISLAVTYRPLHGTPHRAVFTGLHINSRRRRGARGAALTAPPHPAPRWKPRAAWEISFAIRKKSPTRE
jgi:hypothetical protein